MHPQIWIPNPPGSKVVDPTELLSSVGLDGFVSGYDFVKSLSPATLPNFDPSQERVHEEGVMFGWLNPTNNLAIRTVEQLEWVPAIAHNGFQEERYWIGFHPSENPTAADLAHKHQFDGHHVRLGDLNYWLIPQPAQLPKTLIFGNDEILMQASYRANGHKIKTSFIEQTAHFEKFMVDADEDAELDWLDLANYCIESLCVNYRMTPEIMNRLELLDQVTARAILYVCLSIIRNE